MRRNQNCPRCERRLSLSPSGERDCEFCGIPLTWETDQWEIRPRRFQIELISRAYLVVDIASTSYWSKPSENIVEANDALHAVFLFASVHETQIHSVTTTAPGVTNVILRS